MQVHEIYPNLPRPPDPFYSGDPQLGSSMGLSHDGVETLLVSLRTTDAKGLVKEVQEISRSFGEGLGGPLMAEKREDFE